MSVLSTRGRRQSAIAIFTAILAFVDAAAVSAGQPYTIANFPVEARAQDAVSAKEQAIAEGQKAALKSLFRRIVPVTAYRGLDRLAAADAASLLDGVAVRTERNSTTTYIAALDFSFQPDAVREFLRAQGVPYVDTQAARVVLVPVTRDGKAAAGSAAEFKAASGTWANVWSGFDLENTVAPVQVRALMPELAPHVLRQFYDGAGDPARQLAGTYASERVVVAIADVDRAAGRVHVMLAGEDAVGPFAWQRSYRIADGDLAYTLELAAVVSLGVLEGRWKAINDPGGGGSAYPAAAFGADPSLGPSVSGPADDIAFEAVYRGTQEWDQIRRVLLEAPGIDDIRIGSVTAGRAAVSLKYPGGGMALASLLSQYGLTMQTEMGRLIVRSQER